MRALVVGRFVRLVVTLLVVTFLASLMYELLPGDPALCARPRRHVQRQPEEIAERAAIAQPRRRVPVRYADWLGDAVTGDLGTLVPDPSAGVGRDLANACR